MKIINQSGSEDMLKKTVIMGVTGAVLTAGAIAAGVALSNKKNRKFIAKGAKNAFKGASEIAKTLSESTVSEQVSNILPIGKGRKGMGKNIKKVGSKTRN